MLHKQHNNNLVFRRAFPLEVRESVSTDSDLSIEGYAAVFDGEANIWGLWREVILPGAFAESLTSRDQVALWDHDTGRPLARKSKGTLVLREDDHGLHVKIKMDPENTDHRNYHRSIARGDVGGMSFMGEVELQDWEEFEAPALDVRKLKKISLWEVSTTVFPAYETTEVEARSIMDMRMQDERLNIKRRQLQLKARAYNTTTLS